MNNDFCNLHHILVPAIIFYVFKEKINGLTLALKYLEEILSVEK